MPAPERPAGAERYLPSRRSLRSLRTAAADCRGCDLWRDSTQTVFGEGPASARMVMVGEQPGDQEDRAGHPFVGPAGRVLDRALEEAGIERAAVYMTNAVKHFKWEERGKRRIHKTPSRWEVAACRPWLDAELEALRPAIVVLLGAVAAQAVFGAGFRVTRERGRVRPGPRELPTLATVHPSAILRAPDENRAREMQEFVDDLRIAERAARDGEAA
ncbi:MAG: UdgX family uracil-DNA binding protein [Gaiellales bacterium]